MTAYIIRRLFQAAVVVIILSILIFFVIRMLPGDPIEMVVSKGNLAAFSQERIEQIKHEQGLDKPVIIQYFNWALEVLKGNLGKSLLYSYDVWGEITERLPITLNLGLEAFIIGLFVGPLIGVISAIKRGTWIDYIITVIANIGITAPTFWIGILLIYLFGFYLKLLPIYGYTSPFVDLGMNIKQSIMPVFVLAFFPIASAARQTRANVIEVLQEDYVRTAWSKGLSEKAVIIKHVLKNSLIPVVTLQGITLRRIIGGSVIVETVFVIPGMGKFLVDAMLSRDYTVIQGTMFFISILVVLINLFVDLLYGWLDPKIKYG